jgi:hypothetical protein
LLESAIPFLVIVAAALNSTAVLLCALRQFVGTLVDLFAFFRYKVSDRVHTLLSRFLHVRQLLFHVRQLLLLAFALLRRHSRHIADCKESLAHRGTSRGGSSLQIRCPAYPLE